MPEAALAVPGVKITVIAEQQYFLNGKIILYMAKYGNIWKSVTKYGKVKYMNAKR